MDSIITQLGKPEAWEEFLAYRLRKGRYNWHDFDKADTFVEEEQYRSLAARIARGEKLGIPNKKVINKMGSSKKRVVYSFDGDTMRILRLLAHLLYRYDNHFASNCYAFRRGMNAHDAIRRVNKSLHGHPMWAYKLDIHDYFNSIPIPMLLPMLKALLADDPPLYAFFEQMLTERHVMFHGAIIEEDHGIMAGLPTAPFLANVYLSAVDHHFADAGVLYARYSDDIILFAPDSTSLEQHRTVLLRQLNNLGLEVNPDKERIFAPEEGFEFLGFRCQGYKIDIAASAIQKMKGKISRQSRALMRWRNRKGIAAEPAMKALIKHFNNKFFESDDPDTLTWSRWYFPILTQTEGMNEIDRYLQQQIRYLSTGKHNKANYRIDYAMLKALGYKSLVHEYWSFKKQL